MGAAALDSDFALEAAVLNNSVGAYELKSLKRPLKLGVPMNILTIKLCQLHGDFSLQWARVAALFALRHAT